MDDTNTKYTDIITLPAHKSETHEHMTGEHRAAQFAPFAALTGFEEKIQETGEEDVKDKNLKE